MTATADELPVVFVHGIRLSGAMWTEQLDLLGPGRPALAPDLPGHGRRRGERFTLDGAAGAVVEAADRLGGRALLVGVSLGGFVALAAAGRHPERFAGVLAAGCTSRPDAALRLPFRLGHRAMSALTDGGEALGARILRRVLPPQVAGPAVAAGLATEVVPDVLAAARDLDPLGDLARYPGPVWLLNGRHDHFRRHERQFAAANPRATLVLVPGAGHYLPMTHGLRFARLVADFGRLARS
ncbi:alpha/beta hydrolase [Streptomyces sp. KS 21]|uniref:alpha/beta fold hydrolase n=1 Tax=Streptomyces sp. KS 21 TaxID=2485150 RepID=UPI0010634417|nr:alpha/beta hydrolase [Streptomyces sp. KS 21]TDU80626.1 pimeloyl-ACP methyl ester carboxylesterase [Streptomyces sp. KS 21]